jgi:sulfite reductase beta subunit-like hemoprotein
VSDIGFFGIERSAHGRAAPGYQMLLGGRLGEMQVEFGQKSVKLPAKATPEAVVRIVGRFAAEREAGETFSQWMARAGGVQALSETVKDLDSFPAPDVGPDFFVDYDETGPYEAAVGDGECAAT